MIKGFKDFIASIWNDFTPLGKCTIAIPIIILALVVIIAILPLLLILFLLVKSGAADRIEKSLENIQGLFIKNKNFKD
jgi:hypothetical protein